MIDLAQRSRERPGRRGSRRLSIVFLLAVSVLMLLFSLYGARASAFEKAREVVLDVFEPVLSVFSMPINWVDNRVGDVGDYFNTLEQNQRLREENEELRAWMQEALTLRQQVAYFKEMLSVRVAEDAEFVDAQVIGEAGGPYQRSLIVNAGTADGVEVGDGVIGTAGLIGHVVTAGKTSSRVLMLTDANNRTPVFVEGAEIEAILAGRFGEDPELKFFASRDRTRLRPGMRVITSGTGGRLPRGIAVGEIALVEEATARVHLFTQYNDTDFVRIVDYSFSQAEPEREENGEEGAPSAGPGLSADGQGAADGAGGAADGTAGEEEAVSEPSPLPQVPLEPITETEARAAQAGLNG